MASISASGLGSGLDIGSLVSQLVAAEREPATRRMNLQEAGYQARLSGFGLLRSALAEFQGAASALRQPAAFRPAPRVSSSDRDLVTATATAQAATGSYAVEVVRLARAQKLLSGPFAGSTTPVGTGTLTIGQGTSSFSVTIAAGSDTLAAVRDAINAAAGNAGVRAGILNVDDGLGGTVSKLVLSAQQTGSAGAITVSVADDDGNGTDALGLSRLAYDPGAGVANLSEIQGAVDALVRIDGQDITRSSNRIEDAVDGLTLTLVAQAPGTPATLTVTPDDSATTQAVGRFVDAYNALFDAISEQTRFDPQTRQAAALFGDATVRSLSAQLRRLLGGELAGGGPHNSLPAIGVTTDRSGRLGVDQTRLKAAIEADGEAVAALFTGADGYATRLDELLEAYGGSGGILDSRTEGLNDRIERLNQDRLALDQRLQAMQRRLTDQFSAMDTLVGTLRSTSDFLSQQLVGLQALIGSRSR
jgi:flagellar hook-associated protein 2